METGGRKLGHWGHLLEGDCGAPVSSYYLFFIPHCKVNGPPLLHALHGVLCHKAMWPVGHELKPPKLGAKITISSF